MEFVKIQKVEGAISVEDPETPSPIRRSNRVAQKKEEVGNAKRNLLNNNEFDGKFTPPKHLIKNNLPNFEPKGKHVIVNDTRAQLELASRQYYNPNYARERPREMVILPPKVTFSPKKNVSPFKFQTQTSSTPLPRNKQPNFHSPELPEPYVHSSTAFPSSNKKQQRFSPPKLAKPNLPDHKSPILPSLTDDMFVMEAPSFIIPYVYEKPAKKSLKMFLHAMTKDLDLSGEESLVKNMGGKRKLDKQGPEPDSLVEDTRSPSKDKQVKKDNSSEIIEVENAIENYNNSFERAKNFRIVNEKKPIPKMDSPFDTTLGKFFVNIGENLVQEFLQHDIIREQKKMLEREKKKVRQNDKVIRPIIAALRESIKLRENANSGFSFEMKMCKICSFKTESSLVLEHHKETPHMKMDIFKCNFCVFETKSPHGILYHVENEHKIRSRLERAPGIYQCPNCFFEENSNKNKMMRHLTSCSRRFIPQFNLKPGLDWEFPAKILSRMPVKNHISTWSQLNPPVMGPIMIRPPNFRPPKIPSAMHNQFSRSVHGFSPASIPRVPDLIKLITKPIARVAPQGVISEPVSKTKTDQWQGSRIKDISDLTEVLYDRTESVVAEKTEAVDNVRSIPSPLKILSGNSKLSQVPFSGSQHGLTIRCEICDYDLKGMMNLRFHIKMFHKITISEKTSALRPPLNCQKCTNRFFTDQGLERHLLGSHGLITPAMERAAQNNKDSGRCPICGKSYQWKLVAHVKHDHNKILKPAHLSYRCTVCSQLFPLYKEFETHVYVNHSPSVLSKDVTKITNIEETAMARKLNLGHDVSLTKV